MVKVLEAAAAHPNSDSAAIAMFAGVGGSTTGRTLAVLIDLGLVQRGLGGGYLCSEPAIKRGIDNAAARQFLRRALLAYRPFEAVIEGLALGESGEDAVRKARVLLGIPVKELGKFDVLLKWGQELALLKNGGAQLSLSPEISPTSSAAVAFITPSDVESEAKARLYVAGRIGRDAYNALDEKDRGLLAASLLAIATDPSGAVEKSGQAVENYLRELCDEKGLGAEASKLNGGSQLASLLMNRGLIHSHQQKLVDSASMLRNAKAHHKDKKTLAPWLIDEDGALASFFSAVTAVKSIHSYIATGKQIL
jgi:hypothetical protein